MADVAASVLARLKNKSIESGRSYQLCLQLFCLVKQARRFTRIAGRFLCLYLFSSGWAEPTRKPCRTLGLG